MDKNLQDNFLSLVRLGIGHSVSIPCETFDWQALQALAMEQGLYAIAFDGVEKLSLSSRPPQDLLLEWIGEVLQGYEYQYGAYKKAISELAGFYNVHGYKMMVLKGYACSLDWPRPEHRPCGDIDIWLFGKQKEADSAIVREKGIKIDKSHHHHTVFNWQDFTVENHYDFINTKRHLSHRGLERVLKEMGKDDSFSVSVDGEKVYLPSPNLHALFLVRHALNHFASIGINLRQVLDWAFFVEKHHKEIDWVWLHDVIDEYHMTEFFSCMNAICVEDLGFNSAIFHGVQFKPGLKDKILNDIFNPEYPLKKSSNLIKNIVMSYSRWKGNAWKRDLCYKEKPQLGLLGGIMSLLMKPCLK